MKAVTSYLRLLARCAWVQILSWTGALRWAEQNLRERGAIVALTLHRVLDDVSLRSTNSLPGIIIRERTFAELVRYICERHEPVSLAEATPGSASQAIRIVTTFDDGWRDNYTTALPIVQAWRLPITIFVCPALVEQQEPFWPERAVALLRTTEPDAAADKFLRVIDEVKKCTAEEKRAFLESLGGSSADRTFPAASSSADRTLLWSEIVEMGRAGVCFGSHTDTHQILTTISAEQAREELSRSKAKLEQVLHTACNHFAYPNGNWSAETRALVQDAGFSKAVTTERGAWTAAADPLAIPRSNVSESNVVGLSGRFWPAMFQYTVIWKAWRTKQARLSPSNTPTNARRKALYRKVSAIFAPIMH